MAVRLGGTLKATVAAACAMQWPQGPCMPRRDGGRPRHAQAAAEPEEAKFLAFVGSGRRLDGKPAAGGEPVPVTFGAFGPRLPAPAPGARARLQALARADVSRANAWHSLPPGHPFAPACPWFRVCAMRQASWRLQAELLGRVGSGVSS